MRQEKAFLILNVNQRAELCPVNQMVGTVLFKKGDPRTGDLPCSPGCWAGLLSGKSFAGMDADSGSLHPHDPFAGGVAPESSEWAGAIFHD